MPHLNEPPTCALCALHLAPKYHTDTQSEFQGQEIKTVRALHVLVIALLQKNWALRVKTLVLGVDVLIPKRQALSGIMDPTHTDTQTLHAQGPP